MALTEKQKRFADEFIVSLDAADAYRKAGYKPKSDKSARNSASRLLANVGVMDYMQGQLSKVHQESVASAEEVLITLTGILRGERTQTQIVTVKKPTTIQMISAKGDSYDKFAYEEEPMEIEVKPSNADVNKAAELIGKYHKMWTDKQQVKLEVPEFIDDVPGSDEDAEDADTPES